MIGGDFTCPECGSHFFGTDTTDWDNWIGHCHGLDDQCTFEWPRSEDAKYFHAADESATIKKRIAKLENELARLRNELNVLMLAKAGA